MTREWPFSSVFSIISMARKRYSPDMTSKMFATGKDLVAFAIPSTSEHFATADSNGDDRRTVRCELSHLEPPTGARRRRRNLLLVLSRSGQPVVRGTALGMTRRGRRLRRVRRAADRGNGRWRRVAVGGSGRRLVMVPLVGRGRRRTFGIFLRSESLGRWQCTRGCCLARIGVAWV